MSLDEKSLLKSLLDRDAPGDRTRAIELLNAPLDGDVRYGMMESAEEA